MRAVIEISRRNYLKKATKAKLNRCFGSSRKRAGKGWQMEGLTDTYMRVTADADGDLQNQFSHVLIPGPCRKGHAGIDPRH